MGQVLTIFQRSPNTDSSYLTLNSTLLINCKPTFHNLQWFSKPDWPLHKQYWKFRIQRSHKESFDPLLKFRIECQTKNHTKNDPASLWALKELRLLRNKSTNKNALDSEEFESLMEASMAYEHGSIRHYTVCDLKNAFFFVWCRRKCIRLSVTITKGHV